MSSVIAKFVSGPVVGNGRLNAYKVLNGKVHKLGRLSYGCTQTTGLSASSAPRVKVSDVYY